MENKRLSAVLARVKARQAEYDPNRQGGMPPGSGHQIIWTRRDASKGRASRAALAAAVT